MLPVPTRGGAVCCNPKYFPWGPMDQRPVEQRKDVLVYTTRPLRHDLEVVGPVQAVLFVATSARDTDFTAKLVDVFPDGTALNLTDGILRLRYRNSLEKPEPATPGEVYRVAIDAGVTGNVFRAGHRIRLEISSSNFPRFDRNANTGGEVEQAVKLAKGHANGVPRRRPPQFAGAAGDQVGLSSGLPIYLQLVDQIRHAVEICALTPGDQLPSVRVLAHELVISPNTVVKAYTGTRV